MRPLLFASLALSCAAVTAQTSPDAGEATRHIVTFEQRSFDLLPLREAILADRSAAEAEAIVEGFQASAEADQSAFAEEVRALGGKVLQHYWIINGCAVEVPGNRIDQLRAMPGVRKIYKSETREPMSLPLPLVQSTNADNHNSDAVNAQGIRGAGVGVAIVDSSFDENMGGTGRPHAVFYPNGDLSTPTGSGLFGSRLRTVQIGTMPVDMTFDHGTRVASIAIGGKWNPSPPADDGHAPEADCIGYAISITTQGLTELTTMVGAWQQVLADRVAYDIEVGNMSYGGTFFADFPEQQAMDTAAFIGDMIVTTSAGTNLSDFSRHGAVNILSVGGVLDDSHVPPSWGVTGPLPDGRTYPQMLGCGVDVTTPFTDNEAINTVSNGSSHAAPQVAGAAALFRSVATGATAEETRAAILATAEDVTQVVSESMRGFGFSRDDRLIALAQGGGLLQSGTITSLEQTQTFSMNVTAGETYAVALSWSRQIAANNTWANLDLSVWQNGQMLGDSTSPLNANERVRFRAAATGSAQIYVSLESIEPGTVSQPFGLAGAIAPDAVVPGTIREFGSACASAPSNVQPPTSGFPALPPSAESSYQSSSTNQIFGGAPHRVQQVFNQWIFAATNIRGISFRYDEAGAPQTGTEWVDLEFDLGPTQADQTALSPMFANNRQAHVVNVFQRRRVVLPPVAAPGSNSFDFEVVIPLDQAISSFPDFGGMMFDMRVYDTSQGSNLMYPLDAVNNPGNPAASLLVGTSPTATMGTISPGIGAVMGLVGDFDQFAPRLTASGSPDAGSSYTLDLLNARASVPALVSIGFSGVTWGGAPLPLDLAPLQAPGCFIFNSIDQQIALTTSGGGTASTTLSIPSGSSLVGMTAYHQVLAIDPLANVLGLTTSNSLEVVFGGR